MAQELANEECLGVGGALTLNKTVTKKDCK